MAFKNLPEFVEHYGLSQDENGRYYRVINGVREEPLLKLATIQLFYPSYSYSGLAKKVSKLGFLRIDIHCVYNVNDVIYSVPNRIICTAIHNPILVKQYDPGNEIPLNQIHAGSLKKLKWICVNGHKWESNMNNRINGNGCPYCTNRKIGSDNNLITTHPDLAKEYDPTNVLPVDQVLAGTSKTLKWICPKGHRYNATGHNRVYGRGCPYCSHKKICSDNNLAATHPHLALEYDPDNTLPVTQVFAGTDKKLKWICTEGHRWEAMGLNRIKGHNCPYCYKLSRNSATKTATQTVLSRTVFKLPEGD